jgi:hypothetical protein
VSKFRCRCGNLISDTAVWHPEIFSLHSSRFAAEIDLTDDEIDAHVQKLAGLDPPLSRREAVHDLLVAKYSDASRDVMICKDCGRLWLQDTSCEFEGGHNLFTAYVREDDRSE